MPALTAGTSYSFDDGRTERIVEVSSGLARWQGADDFTFITTNNLLLPRIAGYQRAAEKLLLGEPFDAAEAANMGIVNRVLSAQEVGDFAFAQAKKLSALPAASLKATKALMKGAQAAEVSAQMEAEAAHFTRMLTAPEAKEAFTAFFEKRKPDFSRFN